MRFKHSHEGMRIRALALAFASIVCISGLVAQDSKDGSASSLERVRVVNVPQKGEPPTGPDAVVIEHDLGIPTHTVYRPSTLGSSKHPLVVWGEGGCAKNGLTFPEYLTEIASYGFVVVADGPPVLRDPSAQRGGQGNPAQTNGPPNGARAGQGRGAPPAIKPDGTALIAAIDWMSKEVADRSSRFYQKVDTTHVAAMGMSCGGLMAYGASADPRVATVGIWNSGLIQPDEKIFAGLHSPVIIVNGGESDIAYANGKRDFETLPVRVPVFYGVYPSVGHGGTYNQDNGGAFGVAAVAWLKWQLMNDTSRTGKGYFVGAQCGLCTDTQWKTNSRSLR